MPRILSDARLQMARAIKRGLDEQARRRKPAPTPPPAPPPTGKPFALDAPQIYRDRAAQATTSGPTATASASTPPPRPKSFQALVAGYYGTSAPTGGTVIAAGKRGGQ